jgi:hypothetical protein
VNVNEHERFVEEVVRGIFDALDASDSLKDGGRGSQREAIEEMLKQLSPEELADQLRAATVIVEGFVEAADGMNWAVLTALSDCRERVREAHRRATLAAGLELTQLDY